MYQSNELRNGHMIELNGDLLKVLEYHHNKTGRGGAVIKIKTKNVNIGAITEYTCRPGEKFKKADVENVKATYSYKDDDNYYFMNTVTYETVSIPVGAIEYEAKFLIENEEVFLLVWNANPVSVQLNPSVFLEVTETEPGVKGDTVTTSLKPAVLETGLKTNVPLFINVGDKIKVDTRSGEYLERA